MAASVQVAAVGTAAAAQAPATSASPPATQPASAEGASYANALLNNKTAENNKENMALKGGKGWVPPETQNAASIAVKVNGVDPDPVAKGTPAANAAGGPPADDQTTPAAPKFVEAPPPKFNPWTANRNAASVITGKIAPATSTAAPDAAEKRVLQDHPQQSAPEITPVPGECRCNS